LDDGQRAILAAEFAPFFRKEGQQKKAETQLIGKAADGKPVAKNGSSVKEKSPSPTKRDIKAMEANSTVGKVAAKAGVSTHKAKQALKVVTNPVLAGQVANGIEFPIRNNWRRFSSRMPLRRHRVALALRLEARKSPQCAPRNGPSRPSI
jgi:hypothetical protein